MERDNDDIELSPGFFDVHNDEYDEDINNLIPERIIVENDKPSAKNNALVDFFVVLFTASSTSCGCDQKGWTRLATY